MGDISKEKLIMPDVAVLPLAVVGLAVLAGGGGFFWRTLLGRKKRNAEKRDDA